MSHFHALINCPNTTAESTSTPFGRPSIAQPSLGSPLAAHVLVHPESVALESSSPSMAAMQRALAVPQQIWRPSIGFPSFPAWTRRSRGIVRAPQAHFCCEQVGFAAGRPRQVTLSTAEPSLLNATRSEPSQGLVDISSRLKSLFASDDAGRRSASDRSVQKTSSENKRTIDSTKEAQRTPLHFARVRQQSSYQAPQLPCVFLHGLFGFSTLTPVSSLPQFNIDYWRGIVQRLEAAGVEVLVTNVRTSASIEERAHDAAEAIEARFPGRAVNLLGHSMGGLDARYLTSVLQKDKSFSVKSVTTVATPHSGSPFASYLLYDVIGRQRLPTLLNLMQRIGLPGGGGAFECLTTESMAKFNKEITNVEGVQYTSWGAAFKPGLFNEFRFPHSIIWEKEGHNDGLVSVDSSKWGDYKGTFKATHLGKSEDGIEVCKLRMLKSSTLPFYTHADLIGWGNAIQSQWATLTGGEAPFDSQSFYLMVCEDLANEGL